MQDVSDAQAALARNDWSEARARFEAAVAAGGGPDALEGLATAAFALDEPSAVFDAAERAYTGYRAALREARRVGALVGVMTWGAPEQCQAAALLKALGSLLPPPPPGAAGPFALSAPGALEELVERAGLTPRSAGTVRTTWEYPDQETALRALLAGGPAVKAVEVAGEQRATAAALEAIAPCRTPTGGYTLHNAWRYVIAA